MLPKNTGYLKSNQSLPVFYLTFGQNLIGLSSTLTIRIQRPSLHGFQLCNNSYNFSLLVTVCVFCLSTTTSSLQNKNCFIPPKLLKRASTVSFTWCTFYTLILRSQENWNFENANKLIVAAVLACSTSHNVDCVHSDRSFTKEGQLLQRRAETITFYTTMYHNVNFHMSVFSPHWFTSDQRAYRFRGICYFCASINVIHILSEWW